MSKNEWKQLENIQCALYGGINRVICPSCNCEHEIIPEVQKGGRGAFGYIKCSCGQTWKLVKGIGYVSKSGLDRVLGENIVEASWYIQVWEAK